MLYISKNYLLEIEMDSNWGGTIYYFYKKENLLNDLGLKKSTFNVYSTEYEGDSKQLFNEIKGFIYKDSISPAEDLKDIMVNAIGLTEKEFKKYNS